MEIQSSETVHFAFIIDLWRNVLERTPFEPNQPSSSYMVNCMFVCRQILHVCMLRLMIGSEFGINCMCECTN